MDVMATTEVQATVSLADRIRLNREKIHEALREHGYENPRLYRINEDARGSPYDIPEPGSDDWEGEADIFIEPIPNFGEQPMFAFFGTMSSLCDILNAHVVTRLHHPEDPKNARKYQNAKPI
jgi:hypothetical protein